MIKIFPIPAFNDNYIWVILHPSSQQALVVDPGDATPVIERFQEDNLMLSGILITHHHPDHTGGVKKLLQFQKAPVYGPASIGLVNHPVQENDQIQLLDTSFSILEIPGHTLDHIAYYAEQVLFCGDTLFMAGCGRVFEGTFQQMFHSLQKIAHLPKETLIYCAHEYTLANLKFAQAVEPQNQDIQNRIKDEQFKREKGLPTVPASLSLELKTNPFLRCETQSVQSAVNAHSRHQLSDLIDIFTQIRIWKDNF